MAGYVHGQPGHNQPRKILARNQQREVGAFLSVLLVVANNLDPLPVVLARACHPVRLYRRDPRPPTLWSCHGPGQEMGKPDRGRDWSAGLIAGASGKNIGPAGGSRGSAAFPSYTLTPDQHPPRPGHSPACLISSASTSSWRASCGSGASA
jgi:hypothetical protein